MQVTIYKLTTYSQEYGLSDIDPHEVFNGDMVRIFPTLEQAKEAAKDDIVESLKQEGVTGVTVNLEWVANKNNNQWNSEYGEDGNEEEDEEDKRTLFRINSQVLEFSNLN